MSFQIVCYSTCLALATQGQSLHYHLAKADSLFAQKRYTQSLDLYRSIFKQQQYTPAMLLKMAYIEGLENLASSLYYLNLYYRITRDELAFLKIKELADKYRLEGYDLSDRERLLSVYTENHQTISYALMAFAVFLLSLFAILRRRGQKTIGAWGVLLIVLIMMFVHTNVSIQYKTAIVSSANTYLMTGPSAGSSVFQIINEGHRVNVLGEKDIWVHVRWNNKEAYIKKDNLLPVWL